MDGESYTLETLKHSNLPESVFRVDGKVDIRVGVSDGGLFFVEVEFNPKDFNHTSYKFLLHALVRVEEIARRLGKQYVHCMSHEDDKEIKFMEMFGFAPILKVDRPDGNNYLIFRRKITNV